MGNANDISQLKFQKMLIDQLDQQLLCCDTQLQEGLKQTDRSDRMQFPLVFYRRWAFRTLPECLGRIYADLFKFRAERLDVICASFFFFFLIVQSDELRGGPSVVWWQSLQLLGNAEEKLVPAASGYPELYERERTTLPVIFYHIKGSVVRNNSPSLSHNSFKSEHTDTIHIWRC